MSSLCLCQGSVPCSNRCRCCECKNTKELYAGNSSPEARSPTGSEDIEMDPMEGHSSKPQSLLGAVQTGAQSLQANFVSTDRPITSTSSVDDLSSAEEYARRMIDYEFGIR